MNKKEDEIARYKTARCEQCGYTDTPEHFNASLSPYHDLKCPECGTTNIDWNNGSYEHNTLTL